MAGPSVVRWCATASLDFSDKFHDGVGKANFHGDYNGEQVQPIGGAESRVPVAEALSHEHPGLLHSMSSFDRMLLDYAPPTAKGGLKSTQRAKRSVF